MGTLVLVLVLFLVLVLVSQFKLLRSSLFFNRTSHSRFFPLNRLRFPMHDSPLVEKTLSTGADDGGMTRTSEAIMESKVNCFSTDIQTQVDQSHYLVYAALLCTSVSPHIMK